MRRRRLGRRGAPRSDSPIPPKRPPESPIYAWGRHRPTLGPKCRATWAAVCLSYSDAASCAAWGGVLRRTVSQRARSAAPGMTAAPNPAQWGPRCLKPDTPTRKCNIQRPAVNADAPAHFAGPPRTSLGRLALCWTGWRLARATPLDRSRAIRGAGWHFSGPVGASPGRPALRWASWHFARAASLDFSRAVLGAAPLGRSASRSRRWERFPFL